MKKLVAFLVSLLCFMRIHAQEQTLLPISPAYDAMVTRAISEVVAEEFASSSFKGVKDLENNLRSYSPATGQDFMPVVVGPFWDGTKENHKTYLELFSEYKEKTRNMVSEFSHYIKKLNHKKIRSIVRVVLLPLFDDIKVYPSGTKLKIDQLGPSELSAEQLMLINQVFEEVVLEHFSPTNSKEYEHRQIKGKKTLNFRSLKKFKETISAQQMRSGGDLMPPVKGRFWDGTKENHKTYIAIFEEQERAVKAKALRFLRYDDELNRDDTKDIVTGLLKPLLDDIDNYI